MAFGFLQNRQSYSQLVGDVKDSVVKEAPVRLTGKAKGKGEVKPASKDMKLEAVDAKESTSNIREMHKSFCIRFVRLNGILFTRTRYFILKHLLI